MLGFLYYSILIIIWFTLFAKVSRLRTKKILVLFFYYGKRGGGRKGWSQSGSSAVRAVGYVGKEEK